MNCIEGVDIPPYVRTPKGEFLHSLGTYAPNTFFNPACASS